MSWCETASTDGDGGHENGTGTCHGPAREVGGLAVWLAAHDGSASCHITGDVGLDRAGMSTLIAALTERLALMPA